MKKNFIVVTGGAGFIGSNLIELLLKKTNDRIISLDNYSSGKKTNHIKNYKNRIVYVKGDTNKIDSLLGQYKKHIKVIFHFGEYARIHQSFDDVKKCFLSNISGTSKVFNFCLENKIKIIYSATSASLGNKGLDQELSPYAFTKSKNLKLLMSMKKWFGLDYEALYFYNVYGKRQIREGNMATVIGIFEKQYIKKIPLTIVSPGTQTRKFTHIDDTIYGCYLAWKKNLNRHYTISNSRSYSIIQVAQMFSNKYRFVKSRLGERNNSTLVKKIGKIKIYNIPCKISLVDYINQLKSDNSLANKLYNLKN
jgi:UDP-glucose 4-epimerase